MRLLLPGSHSAALFRLQARRCDFLNETLRSVGEEVKHPVV